MFRAGVAGLMSVVLVVRCYKYRYLRFGVRVGVDVWCYILYYTIILYIISYTIIIYYILYYTLSYTILFFCPSSSHSSDLPSVLSSSSLLSSPLFSSLLLFFWYILPIHSIRVGTYIYLFIFQTHQQFSPRMFYRSGWLRCDVCIYEVDVILGFEIG